MVTYSSPAAPERPRCLRGLVNGARVNEEQFTPGWSSYEWRLRYRTVDVTALLSSTLGFSASPSATAGTGAGSAGTGPCALR